MNYLKLLNDGYEFIKDDIQISKLEYLGGYIFNFTTYENIVLEQMATKALEVCNAITNKTTFDYITDENNNLWYLIMVNMPFFNDRLTWGSSIRGAWWDIYETSTHMFKLDTCGLFNGYEQVCDPKLNHKQWIEFIKAMNNFIKS